jgi:hypothetical protein
MWFGPSAEEGGAMQHRTISKERTQTHPLEVLQQTLPKTPLPGPIPHNRQRHIPQPIKHNDDTEPHLPAIDVVFIEVSVEPANSEVVRQRHDPRRPDRIICSDVADDGYFRCEANVAEEEAAEERCEGAAVQPAAERVEEELVAAVCVPVVWMLVG